MARFIRSARDTLGTTIVLIEHDIGVVLVSPTTSSSSITGARSGTAHRPRSAAIRPSSPPISATAVRTAR